MISVAPGSPFWPGGPYVKINQENIRLGWRRDCGTNRNSNTHALSDHQFLIEAQIHVKLKKSCSKFVVILKQANYFHGMLKILNQIKKKKEKKRFNIKNCSLKIIICRLIWVDWQNFAAFSIFIKATPDIFLIHTTKTASSFFKKIEHYTIGNACFSNRNRTPLKLNQTGNKYMCIYIF